jgi:hypothetical protein
MNKLSFQLSFGGGMGCVGYIPCSYDLLETNGMDYDSDLKLDCNDKNMKRGKASTHLNEQ